MPKTPKENSSDGDSVSADQKERQYYYDDAHGYETFVDDGTTDDEPTDDDIVTDEPGG